MISRRGSGGGEGGGGPGTPDASVASAAGRVGPLCTHMVCAARPNTPAADATLCPPAGPPPADPTLGLHMAAAHEPFSRNYR